MAPPRSIERRPPPRESPLRQALRSGPWLGALIPVVALIAWSWAQPAACSTRASCRARRACWPPPGSCCAPGSLADSIFATVRRLVLGAGLGIAGGVLAGFALGLSATLRTLLEPALNVLYTVPKLALLPLLLLVFGAGEVPLIALVAITVFFYMTFAGS